MMMKMPRRPLNVFVIVLVSLSMLVAPAMSYIAEINNQALGFVEGAKQEAAAAEALYEGIPGIDHDKSDSAEFFEELLVARFEDWATENDKEYESDEEKLFRFSVWVQTDGKY
jgi:hypothetical protein